MEFGKDLKPLFEDMEAISRVAEKIGKIEPRELDAQIIEKDSQFLAGLSETRTPELTKQIAEYLANDGRLGSSEAINLFVLSKTLDTQAQMMKKGQFDITMAKDLGIPNMIDSEKTSSEMLKSGHAVLDQEARLDIYRSLKSLEYGLQQHLGKTATKAARDYAIEMTEGYGILGKLKVKLNEILEIPPKPHEIPFIRTEDERAIIKNLYGQGYLSREEAISIFEKELEKIMRKRPESIGLKTSASFIPNLKRNADALGALTTNEVDIRDLINMHDFMYGDFFYELQIYEGFATKIEARIDDDFNKCKQEKSGNKVEKD